FTDRNESNFSLVRLVSKLGRSTVIPLDLCQFLSRDLAGAGGSFFEHFADAAVAGFRAAIVEDTEQLVAALRRRHALPALISARITRERGFQDGRQVAFGFHGGQQALGNLLRAAHARVPAFWLRDRIGEPLADGIAEIVEPAAERSEEHTSELQSRGHLVCRLLLEKKKEHRARRFAYNP